MIGDPRARAVSAAERGRSDVDGAGLSKYGRRSLDQGDCPPTSLPFDYNDPSFISAAQRVGRHLHRCWIDQALGDVLLQASTLYLYVSTNQTYRLSIAPFLARDVIYTSRAYAMMPVRLSVCL